MDSPRLWNLCDSPNALQYEQIHALDERNILLVLSVSAPRYSQ